MGRKIKDIRFEALKKIRNNARNGQFQAVAKQVINLLESENPNEKLIERCFPDGKKSKNMALWAYKLSFKHPVSEKIMNFVVYPPVEDEPWNKFDVAKFLK